MKRDITAIIILAIILGVGIYEDMYFNKIIEKLDNELAVIEKVIYENDKDKSIELCKDLEQYWEKKNLFLEIVFYNPNIKNVSLDLSEILGALVIDDLKSAEARVYVLRKRLKALKETMSFSVISVI